MATRRWKRRTARPAPTIGQGRVAIAKILSTRGSAGRLAVHPLTPNFGDIVVGQRIYIDPQYWAVEGCKQVGHRFEVELANIEDAKIVKPMINAYLEVEEEILPPLGKDEYYHFQLIGLAVQTLSGGELGYIKDILPTGANDVYVVSDDARDILLPATAEVIKNVDLAERIVTVDPLPGLVPEQTEQSVASHLE